MLSGTYRLLEDAGYMKGEERINRDRLADDIINLLLKQPVEVADEAEIAAKALIVAEIRHDLFNGRLYNEEVEKDLDLLITQLVAGDGKVQMKLDDTAEGKYVLCSKRVTRILTGTDGERTMTLTRSGKFLSHDVNVIERFYVAEAMGRLTTSMQKVRKRLELGGKRQPQLETRRQLFIGAAHDQMQLELPLRAGGDTA
jgi:hypothetical protein